MSQLLEAAIMLITAFVLTLILVPLIRMISIKVGLVDKPNHRKVHQQPVPLVGGISIALSAFTTLSLSHIFTTTSSSHVLTISAALVLLIVGVIDDKMDVRPIYRLIVQAACAYAVVSSGIRIHSFYGVLGIGELPVVVQYVLSIIVIVGVVNAYNLMDGIDGLMGGLSLIGFIVMALLAYRLGRYDMVMLYVSMIGAVVGFLRFNLGTSKIFMGDAGSLFIGFLLITSGIHLLLLADLSAGVVNSTEVLILVAGVFLVPVLDSLRVYRARIKRGVSPFQADRNHIHHLFLVTGISHRQAALYINLLVSGLMMFTMTAFHFLPLTWSIITGALGFFLVTGVLSFHKALLDWKARLQQMEND